MTEGGGVDVGIFDRVVNVSWTSGLAVDFIDEANLAGTIIVDEDPINMNKVTMSFWFRVPTSAAEAVLARDSAIGSEDIHVMENVIPLVMWGEQQDVTQYEFETPLATCGPYPNPSGDPFNPTVTFHDRLGYVSGSHATPSQQSCIGVRVNSEGSGSLFLHIQPTNGISGENTSADLGPGYSCSWNGFEGSEMYPGGPKLVVHPDTSDSSYADQQPQDAYIGNSGTGKHDFGGEGPEITLDKWHHLVISWELSSETARSMSIDEFFANQHTVERVTTSSRLYLALDDENLTDFDLPATWIGAFDDDGNPNAVINGTIMYFSSLVYDPDITNPYTGVVEAVTEVSMEYEPILSSPIWLPGATATETQTRETIGPLQVEMAEFQLFTDIALDTGVEANRRAFIDFERDANGDFIVVFDEDNNEQFSMIPVEPAVAEVLLGKKPEILLHSTDNWIAGANTGSTGIEIDEDGNQEVIPEGQFVPDGDIEPYEPDPSLLKVNE